MLHCVFSSVSFQGKVNQRVEGKILLVCDDITVVALQGQLKGQLAHVPTRKVTLKEQVNGFRWVFLLFNANSLDKYIVN